MPSGSLSFSANAETVVVASISVAVVFREAVVGTADDTVLVSS